MTESCEKDTWGNGKCVSNTSVGPTTSYTACMSHSDCPSGKACIKGWCKKAKKGAACFTSDTLVCMATGKQVPIHKIRVGDRVLAVDRQGNVVEDTVVYVPHPTNRIPATFIRLSMEDGGNLSVTPDHFVCTRGYQLVPARSLEKGDVILRYNGIETTITDTTQMVRQGIYDIFTASHSLLIVNGYVASPCCQINTLVRLLNKANLVKPLTPLFAHLAAVYAKNPSPIVANLVFST